MKRILIPTQAFLRSAKRVAKKRPADAEALRQALEAMEEDVFQPALRAHKLKGKLAPSWACSAGYDLRVIFELVEHDEHEAILLEAVGTHDEVY